MPLSRRSLFALDFSGRPRPAGAWLRVHRTSMACRFEITLPVADRGHLEAARKALEEAERVDAMLSTFRDTSEAACLNRHVASEPVSASADFFALLQYCAQLHSETGGAFDVTTAPLSWCWAAGRRDGRQPTPAEFDMARVLVGFDRVRLDTGTGTVAFPTTGAAVSFGAIAKGYAVDRMGQVLRARDVSHALVSAGGSSVLAIGGLDKGWSVSVRSDRPEKPVRLWLRDGALGTSGSGEQFVLVDGRRHGRVLNPWTGQEPGEVRRATVVTSDATTADALSTAFVVAGPDLARSYCEQHADTLAVLTMNDAPATTRVFGRYGGADLIPRRDS
jgi:thiamine biosynthesis lipoprotein